MLDIKINGEARHFPEMLTVAGLVGQLGYAGKRIAVERNGEIVPKSQHATTALATGDQLEIVVAVGGG
ncbi:MAG: sulfur carrier protein ThiS [Azonexus sp.]|jgi:sulfur carrier protein